MNLDDYLKQLFYIPYEQSQCVGIHYSSMMQKHEREKHPERDHYENYRKCKEQFQDIWNNYWQKYHREDPQELKESLAKGGGYTIENLPKDFFSDQNKKNPLDRSLFYHRQTKDTNENKYYFEVIFEPKYQHIRQELIKIHSQFEQIDDSLMRDFIVATIRDYQGGFPDVLFRYKELPSFLECILFHGLCKVHQNEIRRLLNINNEEQKIILYSIFLDFFGEKKLVA